MMPNETKGEKTVIKLSSSKSSSTGNRESLEMDTSILGT